MTELELPFTVYAAATFTFGLLIGSFLNVVIHRVPSDESIVFPGSRCAACGAGIRAFDNIPVLSFILLRGRCRSCGKRISWRYPLVELLTAAIFTAIVMKTGPTWEAGLEMIFAAVMIALVFIDATHHLLPNVITYQAIIFALTGAMLRSGWGEPVSYSFDLSIIFSTEGAGFQATSAAAIGCLLLALAAPVFWLLDRLDLILFNKYFEWQDMNDEAEAAVEATENGKPAGEAESVTEVEAAEAERRYQRTIRAAMILGVLAGVAWAVAVLWLSPKYTQAFDQAYGGLWRAVVSAVVGGMPIWWLRAAYFYIRGVEGMGLGDVKLMAIIGAFLGWQGALGVLLVGSISGLVVGLIMALRSQRGMKTALPFGVCLGAAALAVLLLAKPFFLWYVKSLG